MATRPAAPASCCSSSAGFWAGAEPNHRAVRRTGVGGRKGIATSSGPPSYPAPRRSTVAAGVLSFFAPGAGHIYIGRYRRGIVLVLVFILLQPVLLIAGFLVRPTFYAVSGFMLVILAATILVTTFIMIDAIRLARRGGQGAPWYLWIGAIFACWIGFVAMGALGGLIKPHLPRRT